jgi:serine/threonine-protein kinase RsbW
MTILLNCQLQTPEEFADIREDIEQCMQRVCGKQTFAVYVALNEAVNNAFEHGKGQSRGFVTIRISILRGHKLLIRVKDPGGGFLKSECQATSTWAEGGRGLLIMEQLMDRVLHSLQGNQILMIKYLED